MQRRFSSLLAAVVLGISALTVAAPASAATTAAELVAVGDSVASGNGILPYLDEQCLRSKRSHAVLLAKELGLSVRSAACSGANTQDALAQIHGLGGSGVLGPATEIVTLSVGVNNVEWLADGDADWVDTLIACSDAGLFPPNFCETAIGLSLLSLAPLPEKIAELIAAIRLYAPNAQVVVTGYAIPFGDVSGSCHVGLLDVPEIGVRQPLSFGETETDLINAATVAANQLIAGGVAAYQAVAQVGDETVVYVDVNAVPAGVEGFEGHGLCDSDDRWVSGLLPRTAQTSDRGFHPNAAGQAAYADIIAATIGG